MSECNGKPGVDTEVIGELGQDVGVLNSKLPQCLDDRSERLDEAKTAEILNPNGDGSIYQEQSKTAGKRSKTCKDQKLVNKVTVRRHLFKHADAKKAEMHLKELSDFVKQELEKYRISPFQLCNGKESEYTEEVDTAEISGIEIETQTYDNVRSGGDGREQVPPRDKSTTAVFIERVKGTPIKKSVIEAPSQLYNSDDWRLMKWLKFT
eukprot:TRINITY_DN9364_c0_g1_i2.p1 TRINITY_DN9364_c0_g1~~TRINITY_DN9364_c0_g1_i2.p1  ORF type:complete len:208 (-),score=37.47 TRINITY_DN9364_c0_g1_i2:70-693(-)